MTPENPHGRPNDGKTVRARETGAAGPGGPSPGRPGGATAVVLNDEEMRKAIDRQQAQPLSPLISDYIHHDGRWWIADTNHWLRIDDPQLNELLTIYRRRLAGGLYEPE
jgi:hypothetical protein